MYTCLYVHTTPLHYTGGLHCIPSTNRWQVVCWQVTAFWQCQHIFFLFISVSMFVCLIFGFFMHLNRHKLFEIHTWELRHFLWSFCLSRASCKCQRSSIIFNDSALWAKLVIESDVRPFVCCMSPLHTILLGLSLALKSHDQLQASNFWWSSCISIASRTMSPL